MADPADIAHLLRRTEFVAKRARVAELTPLTLEQAVDNVMSFGPNGDVTPPADLMVNTDDEWDHFERATWWWFGQMLGRPRPFQEKMTLFWHGHFTSAVWDGVDRMDHMMRQNHLYRTNALGNFLTLTHAMSFEPAMLLYLSNATNVRGSPNENFARELMELFTLGVGNYTEDDVAAAARAWTGHNYDRDNGTYLFRPTRHDNGNKTFFGVTKNWDGPDIINEILRDNPTKRAVAARFMARNLWDFFAYPNPTANIVNELADVFLASNLEVSALMRALLLRPEFYSTTAKQGLVRTPTEYAVALLFHTNLTPQNLGLSWRGEGMGQILFNPPNVAGWKANSFWLNTSALSARANMAASVANRLRQNGGFDNIHAMDTAAAVDYVANYFGVSLSTVSRTAIINAHQAEKNTTRGNEWWAPTNLLTMVMVSPEFHMA